MPGPKEDIIQEPAGGDMLPIPSLCCGDIIGIVGECDSPSDLHRRPLLELLIQVHHTVPRLHSLDCPLRDPEHWLTGHRLEADAREITATA